MLEHLEDSSVYGIMGKCVFSQLEYFSVPDSLPPDIMHDCLEGVVPSTLSVVSKNLYDKGKFTVDEFNAALQKIQIPTKDKPNKICEPVFKGKGKISGTASQKWELLNILPQIYKVVVFDVAGEPAWEVYLSLRECLSYIFSPDVEKDALLTVKAAISKYLYKFTALFGNNVLIAKHHYLIYYPEQMTKSGPLRNIWCKRFEAKHQYFKKLSSFLGNYINITHTLSHRHQMKQAYELSGASVFPVAPVTQSAKQIQVEKLPELLGRALTDECDISIEEKVELVSSIRIGGRTFEKLGCYILDVVEEENILISLPVHHIAHVRDTWFLCGKMHTSTNFL